MKLAAQPPVSGRDLTRWHSEKPPLRPAYAATAGAVIWPTRVLFLR